MIILPGENDCEGHGRHAGSEQAGHSAHSQEEGDGGGEQKDEAKHQHVVKKSAVVSCCTVM